MQLRVHTEQENNTKQTALLCVLLIDLSLRQVNYYYSTTEIHTVTQTHSCTRLNNVVMTCVHVDPLVLFIVVFF